MGTGRAGPLPEPAVSNDTLCPFASPDPGFPYGEGTRRKAPLWPQPTVMGRHEVTT